MATNETEIFVPLGEFDPARLEVGPPVTHTFKKGDQNISWTTSPGFYLNEDGEKCVPYFELPEAYCFGVNEKYPIGTSKDDQTPENISGYQVCYPLTSLATIENPSDDEKYARTLLTSLRESIWEAMQRECELDDEERTVPAPTYNSYLGATKGKRINPDYAIKPIYSFPMVQEGKRKVEDRSKPERIYIPLITSGSGRKLRNHTRIHGPGDKKLNVRQCVNVSGRCHPVVRWDGAFWGPHCQKTYGGSTRLKLSEMNFTPRTAGTSTRRMLNPNTAPPQEEDFSDDEDSSFHDPRGGKRSSRSDDESDEEDSAFTRGKGNPLHNLSDGESSGNDSDESEDDYSPPVKKTVKKTSKSKASPKVSKKPTVSERRAAMLAKSKAAKKKSSKK